MVDPLKPAPTTLDEMNLMYQGPTVNIKTGKILKPGRGFIRAPLTPKKRGRPKSAKPKPLLSPGLLKALRYINDHPKCRAAEIADYMWPDSVMHRKVSNQGHGATAGKAAWLAGGSIACKLRHRGLTDEELGSYARKYSITAKGRELLEKIDGKPPAVPKEKKWSKWGPSMRYDMSM